MYKYWALDEIVPLIFYVISYSEMHLGDEYFW